MPDDKQRKRGKVWPVKGFQVGDLATSDSGSARDQSLVGVAGLAPSMDLGEPNGQQLELDF